MACIPYRDAISARLDGEPMELPAADLHEHLAHCADCRTWSSAAETVTRRARLMPVPPVPDLTATVLGALPRELPGAAPAAWPRQGSRGRCWSRDRAR